MRFFLMWHPRLPSLLAAAVVLIWARPAAADLVVSVQSVTVPAGTTGDTFEVSLSNTGASPTAPVGAFAFSLSVGSTQVTFTSADVNTKNNPYLFAGNSAFGPTISTTAPGQALDARDAYGVPGLGAVVGKNATVGLGRVFFNVDPGVAQGSMFTVNLTAASLTDPNGVPILLSSSDTGVSGTITVSGSVAAVPEPSTLALAGLLMGGGALGYAAKRRARAKATAPAA
jgi:hypothetical protein